MLILLLFCFHGVTAHQLSVNVTERIVMEPGVTVKGTVAIPKDFFSHEDFHLASNFMFEDGRRLQNRFLWRVGVELEGNGSKENPIRVVLQHGRTTESFKLPYERYLDRDKGLVTASLPARIVDLCPVEPVEEDSELQITLVSTSQEQVTALVTPQLALEGQGWHRDGKGQELEANMSLSSTIVRTSYFKPEEGTRYVQLSVESLPGSDCFCSIVSVQQPRCPYFTSVSTATRYGLWQTMNETTSMVLKTTHFKEGFLIVVVATESDEFCGFVKKECKKSRDSNLYKRLKIRVDPVAGNETRLRGTLVILGIYLVIIVGSFILSEVQFRYDYNMFDDDRTVVNGVCTATMATLPTMMTLAAQQSLENKTTDEVDREAQLAKTNLHNLCEKLNKPEMKKSMYKKDGLYMGNLLLVSIFYSIAVFQLAFQSAAKQRETGNYNICYFNSRCQIPVGPFLDFNHFYSNLGYAVFGLIFAGIVFRRKMLFNNLITGEGHTMTPSTWRAQIEQRHGIPLQCGIYYTMGGALAMEGAMSASYHICPTTISFQFDTTYMYLIAILIYTKLYQNRHPDIASSSIQTYLVLGAALVLEALSLYFSSQIFWVAFCFIYMISLVCFVSNMYQLNTERHRKGFLFLRVGKLLGNETLMAAKKMRGREVPKIRPLLVFLALTCLANIAMCIFFAVKASEAEEGASNYLLLMFMANMFLYLCYYVRMKYHSDESLCLQAKAYLGKFTFAQP